MTQEEFNKKISDIKDKMSVLRAEMHKVQEEYVKTYPIHHGDKCVDGRGKTCWFSRIYFAYSDYSPEVKVFYPKKDGTRSLKEQNAYSEVTKVIEQ